MQGITVFPRDIVHFRKVAIKLFKSLIVMLISSH